MKQKIELNISDILHLVAKEFHADIEKVSWRIEKETVGYGQQESTKWFPYVDIEK